MLWILGGVFVAFYGLVVVGVRKVIKFLELQRDSTDAPVMKQSDGRSKYLIGIVLAVGVTLIFLNWCIIWFGHIGYAY